MARLWTEETDGERWLVNPALIVANPRPRKKRKAGRKMAQRKAKRRMPAGLRKYWATHRRKSRTNPVARTHRRRRARKNITSTGMLFNRKRRRSSGKRRGVRVMARRRRARQNPALGGLLGGRSISILGFTLPPLDAIVFTGAGLIVPPLVTSFIMAKLPNTWKTNKAAYYGVKAASVILPSMLVRRFVSQRAGNLMLLGGAASFVIDLLRDFAPGVIPGISGVGMNQPFLGYYPSMPDSGSKALGLYTGGGQRQQNVTLPAMISNTPDRLNPAGRF